MSNRWTRAVPRISHVELTLRVYSNAHGFLELPSTWTTLAKGRQRRTIGGKFQYPLVAGIGHVDVPFLVGDHVSRAEEVAEVGPGAVSGRRVAKGAPRGDEPEVRVELLDPMVPGVCHVDVALLVHTDPPGLRKLAVTIALAAHSGQHLAGCVKLDHLVGPAIYHV